MIVYRLGLSKFINQLTGEGAKTYGARWNHIATPCLYTAESRSLALLEYSVNTLLDDIPRALSILALEIPDNFMRILQQSELPGDWQNEPIPSSTQNLGTVLLKANEYLSVKIPSAIIPQEFCYLINPLHPAMKQVRIVGLEDCVYDLRIKNK
jgi:RES domain-containing protein